MFLRGLSYYKLSQYQNALQIFEKYSEWSRWEEKCQFMLNLNKNTERIIQIGEPQVIPDPNTVNIEMYQSNSVVTVTLLIKGLIIDQLKITPLPYSLDIVIDYGHKKFTKSLELYDEIIPKSMELNLTPKKLEIKLEKVHYTKWPTLEKAESDIIGDTNVSLNELIKELDIIPNYTDEEASNLFEQSQSELKQSIKQMTK